MRVFGEPGSSLLARSWVGLAEQDINLDRFLTVEETLVYHGGWFGMTKHDAERRDNLIALLMVEESARICSFAIADKALQQLVAARAALMQALRLDDPQLAKLRADLDQQFTADRAAYCAPDGPWKKAVDETLAHLPGL